MFPVIQISTLLRHSGERTMRKVTNRLAAVVLAALLFSCPSLMPLEASERAGSTEASHSMSTVRSISSMSRYFTENQGQWSEPVQFRTDVGGMTVWFTQDAVWYEFLHPIVNEEQTRPPDPTDSLLYMFDDPDMRSTPDSIRYRTIKESFVGANYEPVVAGENLLSHRSNYFLGNDPNEWHTDVPNYGEVDYEDIYPGVDLKYFIDGGHIKYNLIVSPGTDPGIIQLKYEGASSIFVTGIGDLIVTTDLDTLRVRRPVVYQQDGPKRRLTECGFLFQSDKVVTFEVTGDYDEYAPLIIDPVAEYITYFGASRGEAARDIAVDYDRNAYLTGDTYSIDFPTVNPYQGVLTGERAVFVFMLGHPGNALEYSTFIGGSRWDSGMGIAVDRGGNSYVVGLTFSPDFPVVDPIVPCSGRWDAFVCKLSSAGNDLIYSTCWGGSAPEVAHSIAVDNDGCAYVTGYTSSDDMKTKNEVQRFLAGERDAFVLKLNSEGDALEYSTYLGGSELEVGKGIAVDGNRCAYVVGSTQSDDFPLENAVISDFENTQMAFVTKIADGGNALEYSTFVGGRDAFWGHNRGEGIAVDREGNAYITGVTGDYNFPTKNPIQASCQGLDAFVSIIDSDGDDFLFSTYLGGNHHDIGNDIDADCEGGAYVVGYTRSTDFPIEEPFQAVCGGDRSDAFVTKVSASRDEWELSTFLGGSDYDQASGVAVDRDGSAYVTGYTWSPDFPVLNAIQTEHAGRGDIILAKFKEDPPLDCNGRSKTPLLSAHVGGTNPTGGWDKYTDANVHWRFDFQYPLQDHLMIMAMAGMSQFTTEPFWQSQHPRWLNLSANLRIIIPSSTQLKFYLQGGEGVFYSKNGLYFGGENLGIGVQIPIMPTFDVEFGIDYFYIRADSPTRFTTVQLGINFPLSKPET